MAASRDALRVVMSTGTVGSGGTGGTIGTGGLGNAVLPVMHEMFHPMKADAICTGTDL
jgi:ABC-type methionine transport system permease subunit